MLPHIAERYPYDPAQGNACDGEAVLLADDVQAPRLPERASAPVTPWWASAAHFYAPHTPLLRIVLLRVAAAGARCVCHAVAEQQTAHSRVRTSRNASPSPLLPCVVVKSH